MKGTTGGHIFLFMGAWARTSITDTERWYKWLYCTTLMLTLTEHGVTKMQISLLAYKSRGIGGFLGGVIDIYCHWGRGG